MIQVVLNSYIMPFAWVPSISGLNLYPGHLLRYPMPPYVSPDGLGDPSPGTRQPLNQLRPCAFLKFSLGYLRNKVPIDL